MHRYPAQKCYYLVLAGFLVKFVCTLQRHNDVVYRRNLIGRYVVLLYDGLSGFMGRGDGAFGYFVAWLPILRCVMKKRIADILLSDSPADRMEVWGWVRTKRKSRDFVFDMHFLLWLLVFGEFLPNIAYKWQTAAD